MLHYFGPAVANLLAKVEDLEVFLVGEGLSIDFRVEEVVPALTALLSVTVNS